MPIYEYKCPACDEVYEKIFPINSYPQTIECENIGCKDYEYGTWQAELIWSLPADLVPTQAPTKYYTDKEGKIITDIHYMNPNANPKHLQEHEARNIFERQQLEKKINAQVDKDRDAHVEREKERIAMTKLNRQSDINNKLSDIASKSNNPTAVKELMKAAMERSIRKGDRVKNKKSNLIIETNHLDSSNRERHKNERRSKSQTKRAFR